MVNITEGGYVLSFSAIENLVNNINTCQKKNGSLFEIPDITMPGLGNIMYNKILIIDAGLSATFKPILELKKIFDEFIKPAIGDPTKLVEALKKLAEYVASIKDLLENPIQFIINEIMKPLKNLLLPMSLDLSMFIPNFKVDLSAGFMKLPALEIKKLTGLVTPAWLKNVGEFLLLPIKMIIGLFTKVVEMIKKAVDPLQAVVELPKLFGKLITDFIGTVIDLITEVLGTALEPLLKIVLPTVNIPEINLAFSSMFDDIFKGRDFDLPKYSALSLDFSKIWRFISIIACFLKAFFSIITDFPKLFFS